MRRLSNWGTIARRTPTDWPYMGCVVGSRRPAHPSLPQVISLPHKPSNGAVHAAGAVRGAIGVGACAILFDGAIEEPMHFSAPTLSMNAGNDAGADGRSA